MTELQFPTNSPYQDRIFDDPPFNPSAHLALEMPSKLFTLSDLGYTESKPDLPTNIAATSCFRVLSEEGVHALYHVCKQLEAFTTSNARIARNVRGGVYRSGFLRALALSPEIAEHMSTVLGAELAPHGMPHQLAHLNYQPITPGENVDKWHWDTLQVDYVMFVTDPNTVEGGEFQYFNGTREDFTQLHASNQSIPTDRIIAPKMPGPGYAVLMQGDHVVHQARGIKSGERITLVNGYTYKAHCAKDFSALGQLVHADEKQTVLAEYTRHMSLRCQQQLLHNVNTPNFNADAATHAEALKRARRELDDAIDKLETLQHEDMLHFGD